MAVDKDGRLTPVTYEELHTPERGIAGMTIQRPLTQRQRTVEKSLQLHQPFVNEWEFWTDRFLSTAFRDPPRLYRLAESIGLDAGFMPDVTTAGIFEFLHEMGSEGLVCDATLVVDAIVKHYGFSRQYVEEVCFAFGFGSVGLEWYGTKVREFGVRARLSRQCGVFVTDARPLGELVQEVLEVARVA